MKKWLRRLRSRPVVLGTAVKTLGALRSLGLMRSSGVYKHVPYRGIVVVDCGDGRSFRIESNGHSIENGLYWEGLFAHEPETMRQWVERAGQARVVLDIGANSGVFALAAGAMGAGQVHAFEPLPRVHRILRENVDLNGWSHVHAWPMAVGAQSGRAKLFDPGGEAATSASLSVEFSQSNFGTLPSVDIEVVSVDAFCAARGIERVDLVKLDVEGYEAFALRGMQRMVADSLPVILMEVLDEQEGPLRSVVEELWPGRYAWNAIEEGVGHVSRNVLLRPRPSVSSPA